MTSAGKEKNPIPLYQPRVWEVAILVVPIEAVLGWARNPIGFLNL